MSWPATALVTGAGAGLGLALAAALSRRGTSVVGLVRRTEAADALAEATGGRARSILGDAIEPATERALHPGRIRTRMASADADLTADEAAARFLAWLGDLPPETPVGSWDTDGNRLPW